MARRLLALGFPNRAEETAPPEAAKRFLRFQIVPEENGGYCAFCRQGNLFTQGGTLDEVRRNALTAVRSHFAHEGADYSILFFLGDV
ncbi:MAG: hypothetical protein JO069_07930 [Verrucomicrobia bacterium]|nr:hypothetical protein [Verrucomicrobiota bacterium]